MGGGGREDGGRVLSLSTLCCIFRLVLVRDVYIENRRSTTAATSFHRFTCIPSFTASLEIYQFPFMIVVFVIALKLHLYSIILRQLMRIFQIP